MLQNFRDNLKGTAIFIVVLISIPFALVGIDQVFQGGGAAKAELTVNGENVAKLEVDRALLSYKQRLIDQYADLNPALLADDMLREPVRQQLIREKVIAQHARDEGMGVAPTTLSKLLKNVEAFQVDGRFDRDVFEYSLRQVGHTQRTYYDSLRDGVLISQVVSGVMGTGLVTATDLELAAELIEQKRDYYYLTIPIADVLETVVVDDSQISDYYAKNHEEFETEEQVVVDYLDLDSDDLVVEVDVDDALIREQFDAELSELAQSSRSHIEHILFSGGKETNEKRISEVQSNLKQGKSFAEMALQYSDDAGSAGQGGDLGYIDPEAFPESFKDAVDGLAVGEISGPVETESGVHLIRLVARDAEKKITFEEESPRIRRQLQRQLAEQLVVEKVDRMRELAFNVESLSEVGKELNLPVKTSQPFARSGGEGIAAFPGVVTAAFEDDVLKEGHASEVIELSPTKFMVVKLKEFLPVKTLALAAVKADIEVKLRNQAAQQIVATKGAGILDELRVNPAFEELARRHNLSWQVSIDSKRFGGNLDPEIRDQAFALPASTKLPRTSGFTARNGDFVVLSLTRVVPGELDKLPVEQRDNLRTSLRKALAQREYQAYEQSLVASADVEVANQDVEVAN
tara:strand:+ start:3184 stop:5076 length:1893 start_codon:yes stop_codon:yes gene_type:complete